MERSAIQVERYGTLILVSFDEGTVELGFEEFQYLEFLPGEQSRLAFLRKLVSDMKVDEELLYYND